MSLAFDRSEWFAFDKPADVACRYLSHTNACVVHDRLAAQGQAGCAHYDCYGAGQRVTEELFVDVAWRHDSRRAHLMFEVFRNLKHVHELRFLLHEAGRLELAPEHEAERLRLLATLEPAQSQTIDEVRSLDVEALKEAVHELLRALRGSAGALQRRRRLPLVQQVSPSARGGARSAVAKQ